MRPTAAQLSGRNSAGSPRSAKSVASPIATSDGPPDPAEPVRDDQSHPSVRLVAAHLPTLGTLQWWPVGPAGRPSWSRISSRSLACRESIGRRQLSGMRFWRRTGSPFPPPREFARGSPASRLPAFAATHEFAHPFLAEPLGPVDDHLPPQEHLLHSPGDPMPLEERVVHPTVPLRAADRPRLLGVE